MKVWFWVRPRRTVLILALAGLTTLLVLCTWYLLMKPVLIPMFVVEEHHEALPYWLEAADDGMIPKRGNILIHIDGHSDESTPEYVPGIPFFKWPNTDQEIGLLLQKNDIFIQAAVMAGLISRVVWIYPSWDPTIEERYARQEMKLGWMKIRQGDTIRPHFCECHVDTDDGPQCMIVNTTAADFEQSIDPKLCTPEVTYISEHVHEDMVAEMAKDEDWIPRGSSIILDIDEDFFGCERATLPLTEAGIKWKSIEQLDTALESFLCPWSSHQEDMADDIMRNLIVFYGKLCTWEEKQGRCVSPIKHVFVQTQEKVIHFWRKHPSLFCARNDLVLRNTWRDVLRALFSLTRTQLQALLKMGFCFRIAPVSLGFGAGSGEIRVCHGANTPNDTMVYLHTASEEDTQERAVRLNRIMEADCLSSPALVTLCRSVRDGYTPREQASHIEQLILNSLINSHPPDTFEITYDRNLLGGKQGWPSRSRHSVY